MRKLGKAGLSQLTSLQQCYFAHEWSVDPRSISVIAKVFFSSCHERGIKKEFWVSVRNRTSNLRIPRSNALPLSHRLHGKKAITKLNTCSMLTNAMADDILLVSSNINEPSTRLLKKSNLYHHTIFFLLLFIIPFSFTATVAAICPGTFICLRKSSKRLRKCSGVFFVNDWVLYKNPDTLEINITRFWLKKRWKVSEYCSYHETRLIEMV